MGKPIYLHWVRPSGKDLRQFGVMGSIGPTPTPSTSNHQGKEGDAALQLPFFSGNHPPGKDEVSFGQRLSAVERAQLTSSSSALYCWISRSVREPAAQVLRNVSVGTFIDSIMSSFKLKYGTVVTFDELMKRFLSVYQFPVESVTDYAVRLEKVFAEIRDNYPKQLEMVDKTQHLRERFYQGLRIRFHQKLTPWYEDGKISYMVLLKKARQLEAEDCPPTTATSKGARDDPQMQSVIQTLQEIKAQIQQGEDPVPNPKKRWRGRYGCNYCGEPGHWRRTCPTRFQRKRKKPPDHGGVQPLLKTVKMNPLPWKRSPSQLLWRNRIPGMLRDLSYPPSLSTTIQIQLLGCLAEPMKLQLK